MNHCPQSSTLRHRIDQRAPVTRWGTSLLQNMNLLLLTQGIFITKLGSAGCLVAITLSLKAILDSGSIMALVVGASTLPTVLLSAYGGWLSDRFSKPKIMVAADVISGLASVALACVFILSHHAAIRIFAIFLIASIHTSMQAFFDPASRSLIPQITERQHLLKANSAVAMVTHSSNILGQTAAGFLYALTGPVYLFLIDGLSYFGSAISECFIQTVAVEPPPMTRKAIGLLDNFKQSWRLSKGPSGIRGLFLLEALVNFISAPTIIYLTFLTEQHLGLHPSWYSWFLAFLTIGGITGSLLVRRLKHANRFQVVVVALVFISLSKLTIAQSRAPLVSILLLFLEANLYTIIAILNTTTLQEKVSTDLLGRTFGLKDMFNRASVPFGMMAGGLLVDLFQKNMAVVFSINGMALLLVSLGLMLSSSLKNFFDKDGIV